MAIVDGLDVAQPDPLRERFANSAGISVQQQLDVAPVDLKNFSATFNDVTFVVGEPDPTQPAVDLNINTPNPIEYSAEVAQGNLQSASINTSWISGIMDAAEGIGRDINSIGNHLSGGPQANSPAQQITASIESEEPIKVQPGVQPVNTDYQNNYASLTPSTPGLA